ncbi:MAG: MerR family transcriptional regulator [Anaerolineales bacterium]|nr:MerR family transcriptional regulator [Anaerolineales bacterium]
MLRIGDFSRIARVSVQTLRYYDDLGLLNPIEVDRFTGYRYYAFDQLPRLHRILALKDLGLTLEEIARLLQNEPSTEQLMGMLRLKEIELKERVDEELHRLERVRSRLRQMDEEQIMPNYEVVLKKLDPQKVAGVRGKIPSYPEQFPLWHELGALLSEKKIPTSGACLTLYYSEEPDIDAEVCEPVARDYPDAGSVKFHTLPAVEQAACVVHHGPFTTIGDAYGFLAKWIEASGYECIGPVREVYLRSPKQEEGEHANQNDPETVTEIQFPVKKK